MAITQAARSWIPIPKTFLGLMALQSGTEVITLTLLLNKITGVYGLLALFTGYELSVFQLLTYIYSVIVLLALVYIFPHIRKQTLFENVALAWLYAIDTVLNIVSTATFGMHWYLANSNAASRRDESNPGEVQNPAAVMTADSALSIVLIVFFTLIRVYFSLVVLSYARQVVHRSIRLANASIDDEGKNYALAEPFSAEGPDGQGWRGRMGRGMIAVGRSHWIGDATDNI